MLNQLPVIRTYTGRDREATKAAYRADSETARSAGWAPVAHRWQVGEDQVELSVVYELREEDPGSASAIADWPASDPTTAALPVAAVAPGASTETAPAALDAQDTDAPLTDEAQRPGQLTSGSAARAHARAIIETIDLHAGGEPIRLIRSGYPPVPQAPILERRRWVLDHADGARQAMMFEPRGHRDMYGAVLLPPYREDADIAVLFMHNAGYSTMCGHGVIALTTGLIEEGLYPATMPQTTIRWETPAGLVTAVADVVPGEDGGPEVRQVRFTNVPSYLHRQDIQVTTNGGQSVRVDLAFGGAYYGIVDAAELGLRVVPEAIRQLTDAGAAITEALRREHTPTHPTDADLGFVYGTIIVDHDPASSPDGRATGATLRNVTIFADAEVDRSPCGSGTSALLAWLHASGRIEHGRDISNASITGEVFLGRVEGPTTLGDRSAVVTSVAGQGFVTGYHTFVVDERDPLGDGFLLR